MSAQASSSAEIGDIVYGNKAENSIWPVVIVGAVVLFGLIAGIAFLKKKKTP